LSSDTLPESFHPVIRSWFAGTYEKPTAVQEQAWPLIEKGAHVLALAPTGSGKTLTAFLSAISRFCQNSTLYPANRLTVLYVSPLKALNEDIRRNLLKPLEAIRPRFEQAGLQFPDIKVETRSGDTPQSQRRRFYLHPPSILALTPESLAILLLNPKGRQALSNVKYLILDEIHAVLGNKRGAFLSCQIDRLSLIAGEFQRISLSATIRSPEIAAAFVGGIDQNGLGRKISIVAPSAEKKIELTLSFDDRENNIDQIDTYGRRYTSLINYILNRISGRSTILVFTESRRRAERLCYFINQEARATVAFTHHGSLSKELRQSVERRLAAGSLFCVVATASLELGIDIGSVDEVVLAGSPSSVSQALQRIGRSGHGVGMVSRGILFPFHGMDLLLATALKGSVEDRDIEEIHPIENPLDILAQMILALCIEKKRNIDELYSLLKGFYIFRNLNREAYLRTVRMLAGFSSNGDGKIRLRDVKPRIWLDNIAGEIGALDGSLLLLYSSGGVIANRGLYSLRLADGTKIGELDEEFVWERRLGDRFHFGGRGWRITAIEAESVQAAPLETLSDFIPFWKADTVFRSPRLTERVLAILDGYNGDSSSAAPEATALAAFLDSQRNAQGGLPLSGGNRITIEIIDSPENRGDLYAVVMHSFRGGAINYPLVLALAQELEEMLKLRVESFSNDDSLLLLIPRLGIEGNVKQIENIFRNAVTELNKSGGGGLCRGERLFRNRLEASGIFGASFREAAERSLLLPKAGFGKRTPLWITRQRSRRLFDAVRNEDGFPVTAEAWRSCLVDLFDMEGFRELLGAINDNSVALSFFYSSIPSPFSRDMVRQETNTLMYEYDERKDIRGSGATLSDKVIQEALGDASLRPVIKAELADSFSARLRREEPGWAPDDQLSLYEWVKERIAIPLDEWETLCASLPEKLRQEFSQKSSNDRLVMVKRNDAAIPSMVHREWEESWRHDPLPLLGPWLRYEGPISLQDIAEVFGISPAEAEDAVNALAEVEEVVCDVQLAGDPSPLICDSRNLEMLLRLSRRKQRPEISERPASLLVPFLALRQNLLIGNREQGTGTPKVHGEDVFFDLCDRAGAQENAAVCQLGREDFSLSSGRRDAQAGTAFSAIKKLNACCAPVKLWETEFFTARCAHYSPEIINQEINEGRLVWYGMGKEKIGLCRLDDLELVSMSTVQKSKQKIFSEAEARGTGFLSEAFAQLINRGFFDRPRDFWEIKDAINTNTQQSVNSKDCAEALWLEAWQGRLSSDSFEPLRRGIQYGFTIKNTETVERPPQTSSGSPRMPRIPRSLRDRWREGAPVSGRWFSIVLNEATVENTTQDQWWDDPLNEESRNRDKVRLLLARWGILCRPLLEKVSGSAVSKGEPSPFSWSGLLPTMRRMELAGELVAGRFFAGINSLQFASPAIARELENAEAVDGIYWMNAVDPASPSGINIEGLDPRIPDRQQSSRLYFRGAQLIAVSNRNGKEQHIFIAPDDPDIPALIDLIKIPRTRKILPDNKIVVDTINGKTAGQSEYARAFQDHGFVSDRGRLCFWGGRV
jgi:ATP-dependent helicase Lhr and Lhr-like helicase